MRHARHDSGCRDTGLALTRKTQESLANTARHAPHQPVGVRLDYHEGHTALTVVSRLSGHAGDHPSLATGSSPHRSRAVAIVVLTTYADDTSILTALAAGACSYFTKDADRAEIASALRPSPRYCPAASPEERRNPGHAGTGHDQPDIAAERRLSAHTIKSHINRRIRR